MSMSFLISILMQVLQKLYCKRRCRLCSYVEFKKQANEHRGSEEKIK